MFMEIDIVVRDCGIIPANFINSLLFILIMEHKQAILVRIDLKLPPGKLAVQVAHAAVDAALGTDWRKRDKWTHTGQKKVVLRVTDEKQLKEYIKKAKKLKLNTALIKDAGRTFLKPGTVTCGAIGPDKEEEVI